MLVISHALCREPCGTVVEVRLLHGRDSRADVRRIAARETLKGPSCAARTFDLPAGAVNRGFCGEPLE